MNLEEFAEKYSSKHGDWDHKEFMRDLAALRKELLGGTEGFDEEGRPKDE